jgi:hypothetical protein
MLNVCANCDQYRPDKTIEPHGDHAIAICPECGHRHRFLYQPLFLISGASGTGKTTVCQRLMTPNTTFVALDSDILWRAEFNQPEDNYRDFSETWLRVCKNIGQSGRPVALFGAGFGVPDNIEPCIERRYFSGVHYLTLVCSEAALTQRLTARPAWRGSGETEFIAQQHQYNQWLQNYGEENPDEMTLLDTSNIKIEETVKQVEVWIKKKHPKGLA